MNKSKKLNNYYMKANKYHWEVQCVGDDYWIECANTGIKIIDWGYDADIDGNLLYKNQIVDFPKLIEFPKVEI